MIEYGYCTDCGVDTFELKEESYQVRIPVWNKAYPRYNTEGIGIGESRPCIGCLEKRIGRQLTRNDFTRGIRIERNPDVWDSINHPTQTRHSDRLIDRLNTGEWKPWPRTYTPRPKKTTSSTQPSTDIDTCNQIIEASKKETTVRYCLRKKTACKFHNKAQL